MSQYRIDRPTAGGHTGKQSQQSLSGVCSYLLERLQEAVGEGCLRHLVAGRSFAVANADDTALAAANEVTEAAFADGFLEALEQVRADS